MPDSRKVEESRNALDVNMIGECFVNGKLSKRPCMPYSSSECPPVCFSVFTEEECGVSRMGVFLTAIGLVSSISEFKNGFISDYLKRETVIRILKHQMLHGSLSLTSGFLLCQNPATAVSISSSLA